MSQNFKDILISLYLGADVSGSTIHPFDGRMSCLQFYDYALDPQTISLKKYCPDLPEELKNNPCLENYIYYDGMCYKISENAMSFAKAEMFCVPDMKSPYESQLMYTDNPKTWDYIIQKVKDKHGNFLEIIFLFHVYNYFQKNLKYSFR